MKKYDLVELVDVDEDLRARNIPHGCYGTVVARLAGNEYQVVLFNPQNEGEYAIVDVSGAKLKKVGEFEKSMIGDLNAFVDDFDVAKHSSFVRVQIKEYDKVELVTEREKYAQQDVHKGDIGCVTSAYAIKDEVEVDFTRVDEIGNICGSVLPVKIVDLKIIQ